MEEKNKKLMYAVMFDRENEFKTLLGQYEEDVDTLSFDDKENNLMHFLAYNNRLHMMKVAVIAFKERYKNDAAAQNRMTNWVNSKNKKGVTPIFYAVYNGNVVG